MLALIAECRDADVTFTPYDPDAYDPNAADPEETFMAWTLGHVIVHTTATSDQDAAIAAGLAGCPNPPDAARNEVPWRAVATIAQCRQRLEDSRRLRLAHLDLWPDGASHDDLLKAKKRFLHGLSHDDVHLTHIAKIVQQAREATARSRSTP